MVVVLGDLPHQVGRIPDIIAPMEGTHSLANHFLIRAISVKSDARVYYGGPVQMERGFILHEEIGDWDSTLKVSDQTALTTSRDILEAMARNAGPDRALLALGYAGWGEGQLEREITENAWLHLPADNELMFSTPVHQRWEEAAALLGVDLSLLSTDAGHA